MRIVDLLAIGLMLWAPESAPRTSPAQPAFQPSPEDPNQLVDKAAALVRADLYEDALEAASTAVRRWPEHAAARVVLADAQYRRGDFTEAESQYRRAVELDSNSHAGHFGVGRILRTLGRYGEAAAAFSKAAALAPGVPKYLRTLANHLARREDSLGMLRRYLDLVKQGPATEEPSMIRNVEAWVALLEMMGDRPLSEMARSDPCTLPMQVVKGQAYLKMTVAGLKNQRFVFDTGATGLTISPRIAARAKLTPIKPFTISGTGGRRTETGDLVVIPEIAIGEGVVIRNTPATIRDPAGPEEGLIGPSALSAFDITVDLRGGRLTLEAPSSASGSAPKGPGRAEPFRNVGGQIMISARMNELGFNAMLDTGASSTIVGRSTVARVPGLEALPGRWFEGATVGIGGPLADRKVILKGTLSFAGRDYPAGGIFSGDLSGFSHALESEVYIILGSTHLDDFIFTIDYRDMTVTFIERKAAQR